jgi:hypothetical protein
MTEAEFARPIVTVDIVLLTLREARLCLALRHMGLRRL